MKFTELKLFQSSLIFKWYLLGPIIFDREEKSFDRTISEFLDQWSK